MDAIMGTGILLQAGDGATPIEHFASLANLISLKPNQLSRKSVEVATHNAKKARELLGVLRTGQVTGSALWLPKDPTHNSHTGIVADIMNNTWRNWRILVPPEDDDPQVLIKFNGAVQLFDPNDVGVDSLIEFKFALTLDLETFEYEGDAEES
jgi:hypothetical protein